MTRLEVFVLVAAVFILAFILELVRRRQLREKYALLWFAVGVMALLVSILRPLLDSAAAVFGVAYPPTLLFLFSTVFLMLVAGHLSWEVSRLEEKTRRLAEEIAIMQERRPDQTDGVPTHDA